MSLTSMLIPEKKKRKELTWYELTIGLHMVLQHFICQLSTLNDLIPIFRLSLTISKMVSFKHQL
jgi:hypothetical protein